jgi:hypothetical protein
MAILAVLRHIRENRLHMALRALHFFVHAPQGILRLIVVKLGNRLDGPPSRGRVTVLARNRQRPVRAPSIATLTLRKASPAYWPRKQQRPKCEFEISKRMGPPWPPYTRAFPADGCRLRSNFQPGKCNARVNLQ